MADHRSSLMHFMDAPVVVGDPDGRAVYVNPAFEELFGIDAGQAMGRPMAGLFAGGAREAVLTAVADVVARGESTRFRLREDGVGYVALASPILAEDDRVGVVILLMHEFVGDGRVRLFFGQLFEGLDDLTRVLADIADQTGGRRAARYRVAVEEGARALSRLRKHAEELASLLDGEASGRDVA